MRVAIVGTELCAVDRRGGGLEQVLRRWATALAGDHEVVIVSHLAPEVDIDDVYETIAVAHRDDLATVLRRVAPDVVCFNNRPQWEAHSPAGAAVGVVFHNFPQAWKTRRRRLAPVQAAAVSRALGDEVARWFGVSRETVTVVPPSIDAIYLQPPRRTNRDNVLSPNRLLVKKGVLDLLALARRPEFETVTFSIADVISPWRRPTAEHRALRDAVRSVDNAELFEAHGAGELIEWYREAGVVACAVRETEGLGLVALEAQACGAPLVTTDLGGLREATFAPNRCVPAGDLDALGHALLAALRGGDVGSARDAVIERYSPTASGAAFARWLCELV